MYVNRYGAASTPQYFEAIAPHVGASAATAGSATATVATVAARSAAAFTAAPSAVPVVALSSAASASVPSPTKAYNAPFANDMLGVVAGYLPSEDQLIFRQLNLAAKVATDQRIETLTLTQSDAIVLFTDATHLSNLKRLTIVDFDTAGLAAFVEVLSRARYAPFDLILTEGPLDTFSPDVLKRIATLPLSGLTLNIGYEFQLHAASLLADATFPISMNLHKLGWAGTFDAVANLASLTSLSVQGSFLSDNDIAALRSHPSLKVFEGRRTPIPERHLLSLLANPRLKTLLLSWIISESDEVKEALMHHPAITSLQLLHIRKPALLTAVLCNPIIHSLQFSAHSLHASAMHRIAEMPSLRTFTLVQGDFVAKEPDAASMRALCAKPLETLSFEGAKMKEATLAIAASAHAASLSFRHIGGTFPQAAIAALVGNPYVTSLSFTGQIIPGGAAQLAAAPGLQKLSLALTSTEETVERVQRVWEEAGKSLVDLTLSFDA